ncbi:MAG TPA: trypsin-like peptidase domain-containing protein, partial [Acidimicrobiales bacterium]|nr:trypsin-like peptidase domain-containing protein [Acidimicrobiales bacterium]
LAVGDVVLAIGNPLAYSSSVTNGIISATNRTVVEPHHGRSPGGTIVHALQTSAPINPGNSGGALVDLGGKVVGIPTLAAVDPQIGGVAPGIGFAIPANTVTAIANQLIAHGHVVNSHRADLGIYAFQATNASGHPAGVGVAKLTTPSPAGRAGIKPGDVVVAVNGTRVRTVGGLQKALGRLHPGQHARVTVVQPSGAKRTVTVTLGTLPGTPGTGRSGG